MVVASTALGITSIRARLRLDGKRDREIAAHYNVVPVEKPAVEVSDHPTVKGNRAYMIRNLNTLEWRKIHVYIDSRNAHAAIVQRKPFQANGGNVLRYLAVEIFKGVDEI
jgi:hypothetical protein